MVKDEEELIESLRSSKATLGPILPILEDAHGEIIDGFHRQKADKNWPRHKLEHVKTRKDRLRVRIALNIIRWKSAREKMKMLEEYGEILLEEGVPPGEISKRIAEETGMSYRWVMKYLPDRFKDEVKSENASAARRAAARIKKLLDFRKPPREKLLTVNKYGNTDRLHVIFEKPLQEEVREAAEKLEMPPDVFLQKSIREKCREIKALKPEEVEMLRELARANKNERAR